MARQLTISSIATACVALALVATAARGQGSCWVPDDGWFIVQPNVQMGMALDVPSDPALSGWRQWQIDVCDPIRAPACPTSAYVSVLSPDGMSCLDQFTQQDPSGWIAIEGGVQTEYYGTVSTPGDRVLSLTLLCDPDREFPASPGPVYATPNFDGSLWNYSMTLLTAGACFGNSSSNTTNTTVPPVTTYAPWTQTVAPVPPPPPTSTSLTGAARFLQCKDTACGECAMDDPVPTEQCVLLAPGNASQFLSCTAGGNGVVRTTYPNSAYCDPASPSQTQIFYMDVCYPQLGGSAMPVSCTEPFEKKASKK